MEFLDESLTYGELNRRANRLARHLMKHGVGPEVPVAVSMERSLEMIVGILGVLKAGGAYVPLDPSYPPERLAFMVEDSGVGVILTQKVRGSGFRSSRSRKQGERGRGKVRDQRSEVRDQRSEV